MMKGRMLILSVIFLGSVAASYGVSGDQESPPKYDIVQVEFDQSDVVFVMNDEEALMYNQLIRTGEYFADLRCIVESGDVKKLRELYHRWRTTVPISEHPTARSDIDESKRMSSQVITRSRVNRGEYHRRE